MSEMYPGLLELGDEGKEKEDEVGCVLGIAVSFYFY